MGKAGLRVGGASEGGGAVVEFGSGEGGTAVGSVFGKPKEQARVKITNSARSTLFRFFRGPSPFHLTSSPVRKRGKNDRFLSFGDDTVDAFPSDQTRTGKGAAVNVHKERCGSRRAGCPSINDYTPREREHNKKSPSRDGGRFSLADELPG